MPTAAPASNPAPAPSAEAANAWRGAVSAWLQAHKTYPDAARRDGAEGRVVVRFTLDRSGVVQDVTLVGDSGVPVLDDAAVTMLRGARLPPPPSSDSISITLPIRYSLSR